MEAAGKREAGGREAGRPPACWVVTDGKAGMESQCLGLAEAMGLDPVVKRVRLRTPWRALTPWVPLPGAAAFHPASDPFGPPWPDLLIATGRRSAGPALMARARSGGRTFLVQIQDPGVPPARFDLLVVPRHDGLSGPNVVETQGALHRVTAERLRAAAAEWEPRFADLPRPRLAVLLGGDNGVYRFTPAAAGRLGAQLAALARAGWGIMATPSRRTGEEALARIRAALEGLPARIWDGTGENPYFGILGLADAVVATADSVNMVTEAAATGRPLHVAALEGGSPKFEAFHAGMRAAGLARPFEGGVDRGWSPPPLFETARVADIVWQRLRARG